MKQKKKIRMICCIALLMVILCGCGSDKIKEEKIRDIEYTVTSEDNLPVELKDLIDQKKVQPFTMSYQDGEYLFICKGYGQQNSAGYSIQVAEAYETDNAIYFKCTLLGPSEEEAKLLTPSFPYIVIKTEYQDMPVVFEQ